MVVDAAYTSDDFDCKEDAYEYPMVAHTAAALLSAN